MDLWCLTIKARGGNLRVLWTRSGRCARVTFLQVPGPAAFLPTAARVLA